MIVYLAGPITAKDGYTVEQNVESAVAIYFQLIRAGIPAFCPQLGATMSAVFDVPYAEWMCYDFKIIDACSHILMLPRWKTSHGANLEHVYATQQGKIICYDVKELLTLWLP